MSKLVIIGCGNMGSAIISSLLDKELFKASDLVIVEQFENDATANFVGQGATLLKDIDGIDFNITTLLLAVKPQSSVGVFGQLKDKVSADTLVVSIMAGIPIATMEMAFGDAQIIRCMPNTPCAIQQGMSVFCGNDKVTEASFDFAKKVFDSIGRSFQVEDEIMIDSATAISGSGPAYFFYMVECLKEGAMKLGFTAEQAEILTTQTFYGAASLVDQSEDSAATLRVKVTSPGGTTEAALNHFYQNGLKDTLIGGVQAAYDRSIELGKAK